MKKIWIIAIVLVMMTSVAWADTFNVESPLKYTQERMSDGGYLITLSGNLCIPDGVLYVYHQDNMRGRTIRKFRAEPVAFSDNLKQWVVTPFTVEVGQVMLNLYSPTLKRWMSIPTCLLTLGEGLAYGNSFFDASVEHEGDWDRPGGVGIIITATGIPVQYPVSSGNCDQGQAPAPRPVIAAPAPAPKAYPRKKVSKKIPCPDGKGICSQPCIVEIREGVEFLISSVGAPTKDEPADEKTLQQKARKTLDSLGQPDATDEPDEKTVQQKARKTLSHTKKIHKNVGESKSGKSLHDKIGDPKKEGETVMGMLEQIHRHVVPKDSKIEGKCNECHIPGTSVPLQQKLK